MFWFSSKWKTNSDRNECRILWIQLCTIECTSYANAEFLCFRFSHTFYRSFVNWFPKYPHKEYVFEISMRRLRSLVECVAHIWSPINHKQNWEYWIWLLKWLWRWSSKLEVSCIWTLPHVHLHDQFHHVWYSMLEFSQNVIWIQKRHVWSDERKRKLKMAQSYLNIICFQMRIQ